MQLAMNAGEGEPLRFELGPVELEAAVAVEKGGGANAKVRFWVIELGGDAEDMNRRGIKPSNGKQWSYWTLQYVLCNPRVAGLRAYKREVIGPAQWEPIISQRQSLR